MKCPHCAAENKNAAKFCAKCGQSLAIPPTQNENSKPCPDCGHACKPDAKFCPKCGHNFSAASQAEKAVATIVEALASPATTDVMLCPHCGVALKIGAKFCGKCGNSTAAVKQKEALPTAVEKIAHPEMNAAIELSQTARVAEGKLAVPAAEKPIIETATDVMLCLHCGATLKTGAKFCGKCGNSTAAIKKEEALPAAVEKIVHPAQVAPIELPKSASGADCTPVHHLSESIIEKTIKSGIPAVEIKAPPSVAQPQQISIKIESAIPAGESKSCPKCGNSLKPAARFCGKCGFNFEKKSSNATEESNKETSKSIEAVEDISLQNKTVSVVEVVSVPSVAKMDVPQAKSPVKQAEPEVMHPVIEKPTAPQQMSVTEGAKKQPVGLIAAIAVLLVCAMGGGAYWWFSARQAVPTPVVDAVNAQPATAVVTLASAVATASEPVAPPIVAEAAPPAPASPPATLPVVQTVPPVTKPVPHPKQTAHAASPGKEPKTREANSGPKLEAQQSPVRGGDAPPVTVHSTPLPVQKSIDEQYNEKIAKECQSGFSGLLCKETMKIKLCNGKWTENPPQGQSLCAQVKNPNAPSF